MNDENKDIEQVLEGVTIDDAPDRGHQDALEQRLLLGFDAVRFRHDRNWRIIMSRNLTKLAAAAVIVVGVLVAFSVFDGGGSVSWAAVRERVAAIRAVVYTAEVTESGRAMRIEAVQSDDYGTRMDMYMGDELASRSFALTADNSYITLMPAQKKYIVVELTEEILRSNGDPKVMVESFLAGDYQELGPSEIDGVAVEGVETRDVSPTAGFPGGASMFEGQSQWKFPGEVVARLWVDVDTGWPVQVTLDVTGDDGTKVMSIVVSDFQWDARVDAGVFASPIPQDYKLMYTIAKSRPESGEQLVSGLAHFAKLSGGKYPAKLTIGDILGEVGELFKKRSGDPSFQVDDVQISNLKYGAQHFRQLEADGKEPVYNGQSVTSADAGKVLVRWKLEGDLYRVVFGDLRIEDVIAERLKELEAE